MSERIDDQEAVADVVQLYIDGANGDVAKLEKAFHPDARMFGRLGDAQHAIPIQDFFGLVGAHPGLAGPNYRARIVSIDVAGDAAVAVLAEDDYAGCDFVDFFSLNRIDGEWVIVNKTYAQTGGTPPPM